MHDENTRLEAQAGHPESADADVNKLDGLRRCTPSARSATTPSGRLRSDLGIFEEWCRSHGLTALPAGAGDRRRRSSITWPSVGLTATVRRYVASIVIAHRTVARDGGSATRSRSSP